MGLVDGFCHAHSCTGWSVLSTDIYYPDFGDSLANFGTFFIGIHKVTTENASHVSIKTPPQLSLKSLISYTHKPFNSQQYTVCLLRHHKDFDKSGFKSTDCCPGTSRTQFYLAKHLYNVHQPDNDITVEAGTGVYSTVGLCPPFASSNSNIFPAPLASNSTQALKPSSAHSLLMSMHAATV